jgi:hypothetical protein
MDINLVRTIIMVGVCVCLSGCAVSTKSTNLKEIATTPAETGLLKDVGFVIHDEVIQTHGNPPSDNEKAYLDSERKSWRDAVSAFTDQQNIFTMANDKPANAENSFPEFAKKHPIVDVYIRANKEKSGLSMNDVAYGSFWITFLTFGMTPAYLPVPYLASFTLSLPESDHAPSKHWEYAYDRQEYFWLPLLIPLEDYLNSFQEPDESASRWNAQEKRRLVLRFLQDAKRVLKQHEDTLLDLSAK